jgi:hypothetical protein
VRPASADRLDVIDTRGGGATVGTRVRAEQRGVLVGDDPITEQRTVDPRTAPAQCGAEYLAGSLRMLSLPLPRAGLEMWLTPVVRIRLAPPAVEL